MWTEGSSPSGGTKYYMTKMEDAIINLPKMVSIKVAEPWSKNGSPGSSPGIVFISYKGTGEEPKALHDDGLWTFLAER